MDFSQRHGLLPVVPDNADMILSTELRIRLWNVVLSRLFGKLVVNGYGDVTQEYHIFIVLWKAFFKNPMDEYDRGLSSRKAWYRDVFETLSWNRVFDFFEFVARRMIAAHAEEWIKDTNDVLLEERAGIAFVGLKLTPLNNSQLVQDLQTTQSIVGATERNKIEIALMNAKEAFSEKSSEKLKSACTKIFDNLRDFVSVKAEASAEAKGLSWEEIFRLAKIEASSFPVKHFSILSETLNENTDPLVGEEDLEWILSSSASLCALFLKKFERAGLIEEFMPQNSRDATVSANLWGERK